MNKILALLATLFLAACNPLSIEEPPVLAGDFSDPMYPKTYGRVSVELSIDESAAAGELSKTDVKALYLEFYFKGSDGNYVLCKEYENYGAMPSVVLFPVGQYIVVARTKEYNTDREYFRGQIEMSVNETSTVVGKLVCLLLADEFADPIYPKVYGQVALDLELQLGSLFGASRSVVAPSAQNLGLDFYFKTTDDKWLFCKHYPRVSDLPKGVSFPVGNYKLVVRSHEAMADIMTEAYVQGEAQFAIAAQSEAKPKVVCSVRNAWVEVQPTAAYLRAVHSWGATLRHQSLIAPWVRLTKDSTLVRFVRSGTWDLEVDGQQVGDNLPVAYTKNLGALVGGDRAIAVLDAVDSGVLGVQIEVDLKITQRDHNIVFPDDEGELGTGGYNPDPNPDPEPEPSSEPNISGGGFDVAQIKEISSARDLDLDGNLKSPIKVTATAPKGGLQQFEITIDSPDIGLSLLEPLFGGATFDLTNVPVGSTLEKSLNDLGILPQGTAVLNQASFTFDLTAFMALLPENELTHNFRLVIADGQGKIVEQVIRIKRVP